MKKAVACLALILCLLFCCTAYAESILPELTTPVPKEEVPDEVVMPGLQQVSWYDPDSITKSDDGKIEYMYSHVPEAAYQRIGIAFAEAGYVLKENSTDEEGHMHFIVGDDKNEMEMVYYEIGGKMILRYPEYAVVPERDEEALTVHLQLGEPFRTTDECVYSLVSVKAVDKVRRIYKSGYPIVFRYDETRESTEDRQYVVFGYTCQNNAVYEVESDYGSNIGDLKSLTEGLNYSSDGKGTSNDIFTLNNQLGDTSVAGGNTLYYVSCIYYKPGFEGPAMFEVSFMSEDKLVKYAYDITLGEN